MSSEPVRYAVEGSVARLTLDSPHNRNALSTALVQGLHQGFASAAADPGVRCVVLGHTGGTFCAGADLSEAAGRAPGDVAVDRAREMTHLLRAILELPIPVIGAVDGHVRAGGLGLVGACDIVVAGPASTFALTEARIGLISMAAADVEAATAALTAELGKGSPQGLAASKALTTTAILEGFDRHAEALTQQSAQLFVSEEAREGMLAFLEKRPPNWTSGVGNANA